MTWQLDIEWSKDSYAEAPRSVRAAGGGAAADWSMVQRDTRTQRVADFRGGPFPDIQHPVD